jgi:hypothetical protein
VDTIEKRVLNFISLATPTNANSEPCGCNVKPAENHTITRLLSQLDRTKVVGRTFETTHHARGRMILHPAPWVRKLVTTVPLYKV